MFFAMSHHFDYVWVSFSTPNDNFSNNDFDDFVVREDHAILAS